MDARYQELAAALLCALLGGCGDGSAAARLPAGEGGGGAPPDDEVTYPESLPYARSVESFTPGSGAGFNAQELPDIVLGPPRGKGNLAGSLDVVSLGAGGEIVLGFGDRTISDGPGPDFVVFENAFWPGGEPGQVYAELGEVSVSEDGETWLTFACDTVGDGQGAFPGCAGVTPALDFDPLALVPLDFEQTGGDPFDLADLELESARFIKIVDLQTLEPAGTTSGFDLDAVGLFHQD